MTRAIHIAHLRGDTVDHRRHGRGEVIEVTKRENIDGEIVEIYTVRHASGDTRHYQVHEIAPVRERTVK